MKIRWNGHACFTLTTRSGLVIVTDPFDASVGYPCPNDRADLVTVSHGHHDHNDVSSLTGNFKTLCQAGEYEADGVRVTAIPSFHDDAQGAKRGGNLLFKIECDGLTVVHLGDLGHLPNAEQTLFLKNADIMMIPIGGFFTIDTRQALEVIRLTQPAHVIPMHYLTPVMNFPISDEKEFARAANAVYANTNELDASALSFATIFDYRKK